MVCAGSPDMPKQSVCDSTRAAKCVESTHPVRLCGAVVSSDVAPLEATKRTCKSRARHWTGPFTFEFVRQQGEERDLPPAKGVASQGRPRQAGAGCWEAEQEEGAPAVQHEQQLLLTQQAQSPAGAGAVVSRPTQCRHQSRRVASYTVAQVQLRWLPAQR